MDNQHFDLGPWREYLSAFDDYLAAHGNGFNARRSRAIARAHMREELAPRLEAACVNPDAHPGRGLHKFHTRGVVIGIR